MLSLDPALTAFDQQVLIARGFIALMGTSTVVVLYRMARRTADATTGLLAALFLAVALLHVRDSHFATTDVLMTFLVILSLALLLRALGTDGTAGAGRAWMWFTAAGMAGGLAASTKYNAAAILAAMAAAQAVWFVRSGRRPWHPAAWVPSAAFLVAFVVAFLAATPFALLDSERFLADLRFELFHARVGHGVGLGRGWAFHLTRSLPYSAGLGVFVAAAAGLVPWVRHHRHHAFVVGTFAVAFYLLIGRGYTVFFRYMLPLVPILCLLAAVGVRHVGTWLAGRTSAPGVATVGVLTVLVAGPALVNSVWFDLVLARTDTRVLAGSWLAERLRPGDSLYDAGGGYTRLRTEAEVDLQSQDALQDVTVQEWTYDPLANSFGQPDGLVPDWLVLPESPLQYTAVPDALHRLASEKYHLVRTLRGTAGETGSTVYDLQDAFFMPLTGFGSIERPGPTIRIYRRTAAPPLPQPSQALER